MDVLVHYESKRATQFQLSYNAKTLSTCVQRAKWGKIEANPPPATVSVHRKKDHHWSKKKSLDM